MKLFVERNAKEKLKEAQAAYEEANRIVLKSLGKDHPKALQFNSLLFICNQSAEQALKADTRPIELVQVVLFDVSISMSAKTKLATKQTLDRMEISKAFFGAFVDKVSFLFFSPFDRFVVLIFSTTGNFLRLSTRIGIAYFWKGRGCGAGANERL